MPLILISSNFGRMFFVPELTVGLAKDDRGWRGPGIRRMSVVALYGGPGATAGEAITDLASH